MDRLEKLEQTVRTGVALFTAIKAAFTVLKMLKERKQAKKLSQQTETPGQQIHIQ